VANVDADRVFATGLSNGGIVSHYVASELSDRIAAIAPVGGPLMMDAPNAKRPVPVMHFHGTADEFAPFRGGYGKGSFGRSKGVTEFRSVEHTIKAWVKVNGCQPEPKVEPLPDKAVDGMKSTRKTWSGGRDGSEVVLIEIEGGGHTWPGMEPITKMLGPSTKDISANDLMWGFFQKHPRKLAASGDSEEKNPSSRFSRMDANGDGRLSSAEAGGAGFFKAADKDDDGFVTLAEAQAHARQGAAPNPKRTAGMEGDGAGPMTTRVKPVNVSESDSPIQALDTRAADGRAVRAFWRKPKGDGPFPAIVFIHGGLAQFPEDVLRGQLKINPVITRLLDAGYAVVQATFRTYDREVQSRGPIEDVRAVVQALARLPAVDAKRIALYGGSGGGSIALELGGDPLVRAVIAGEPATVLYTGMLTTGEVGPRMEIMAAPEKYLTADLRERTLEKLKSLRAPVLILHSDQHDLHKLNGPLFVPLMKQAGVKAEYREYPGYGHGFYFGGGDDRWGRGADDKVVAEVLRDVRAFLEKEMPAIPSQPKAANRSAWVTPPVRAPRVEFRTFDSEAAKTAVSFHIFKPASYDTERERRFPVLYWLHGSGGGLAGIAPVSAWFDAAIREGKIPPMLVVFPNGLASSMWCDSKDGAVPMETIVIKELLPHIDATFRTIAAREGRIIEGFSMGGYGAARLGFKYPQLFGAVSILAGGPLDLDFAGPRATGNPAERERILQGTFGGDLDYYRLQNPITVAQQQADAVRGKVRVRMAVGARDNTGPLNRAYSEHLKKLSIAHTFTIVPGVGHDTLALLKGLGEANWEFYRLSVATDAATISR
jgi:poly(3-hydroxybutyrate) depolymerase